MTKYNYLIVGGGIAGTTAAETIRKNDSGGTIAIISEEPHTLYSRLTLHHYLKDLIPLERLYLRRENFYQEKKIDLFKGKKAQKLDAIKKEIVLDDGVVLSFDRLLIATGGYPNVWNVAGSTKKGIFYFRTIEDAINIKNRIEEIKVSKPYALVVGGGFIGLDFLTSFVKQGLNTTILVREDYFWQGKVAARQGQLIEKVLRANGVGVVTGEEVVEVLGKKEVEAVRTKTGKILKAGIIGVGIGIHFDLNWLMEAGIAVNFGVLTNQYLETNLQNIFAAGDVSEFLDVLFDQRHLVGNWVNAYKQGEVAGLNMAGQKTVFETVSSYATEVFGHKVVFIGMTDTKTATSTVIRGLEGDESVVCFFLNEGRLIGATLVGRAQEQAVISQLIRKKIDLNNHLDQLADLNFDLASLLS